MCPRPRRHRWDQSFHDSISCAPTRSLNSTQARDAPDGEDCVESNRRPHQNADESHARGRVRENRASGAVVQQHGRHQPAKAAARSIIAPQPAGDAQREQRSAGDTGHDQGGRRIERYPEQQAGNKRGGQQQGQSGPGFG